MSGRGAWPISGAGGTLRSDGRAPGPYYCLPDPTSGLPYVGSGGWDDPDVNKRAVHGAVRAIQRNLRAAQGYDIVVDGVYGEATTVAVKTWQRSLPVEADVTAWGGFGESSARAMFLPQLRRLVTTQHLAPIVCGLVGSESNWDPGAVGYTDDGDLGFAQINGPSNPDASERERLTPGFAFTYAHGKLLAALDFYDGDLVTAIASYNLGLGGASVWKRAGSPDWWTPQGSTTPRHMGGPNCPGGERTVGYVDKIRSSCAKDFR